MTLPGRRERGWRSRGRPIQRSIPTAAAATAVVRAVSSCLDAGPAGKVGGDGSVGPGVDKAVATLGLFILALPFRFSALTLPALEWDSATFAAATGRYVSSIATPIDKDSKEQRDCEIRRLWFACQTQEEISKAVGMTSQGVGQVLKEIENFQFVSEPGELSDVADDERPAALQRASKR